VPNFFHLQPFAQTMARESLTRPTFFHDGKPRHLCCHVRSGSRRRGSRRQLVLCSPFETPTGFAPFRAHRLRGHTWWSPPCAGGLGQAAEFCAVARQATAGRCSFCPGFSKWTSGIRATYREGRSRQKLLRIRRPRPPPTLLHARHRTGTICSGRWSWLVFADTPVDHGQWLPWGGEPGGRCGAHSG